MRLLKRRQATAGERPGFIASVLRRSDVAVPVVRPLDERGDDPLTMVAQEIGRELGGDGLLVTWHDDAGQPRHLFAEGSYRDDPAGQRWAASSPFARSGPASAKSQWQLTAGDPASGTLTTSIASEHGVLVVTAYYQRVGPSTRMQASEAIARLLPFLQPFVRTWSSQLKALGTIRALTSVVNGSDIGVLLLDESGQLTFANSAADELLAAGDGLRRRGNALAAGSLTDTLRLHAAIEQAVASEVQSERSIMALHRRDGRPLMAAVMPNRDDKDEDAERGAIVFVVDPDQDLQTLVEPVCEFYGLSPSETRLACTLVRGLSLSEAAEELHVREQTARTYLKQIFSKTDTNRQVALVRLLLLSAVRTGGHSRASAA